jgi:hypothetical protein
MNDKTLTFVDILSFQLSKRKLRFILPVCCESLSFATLYFRGSKLFGCDIRGIFGYGK